MPNGIIPTSPNSLTLSRRLVLYAIFCLAVALRFYHLSSQSFWLDELWTLEMSTGHGSEHQMLPVGQLIYAPPDLTHMQNANATRAIWSGMEGITGPPLYPIALRVWRWLFGDDEIACRSLSVACSILAMGFFFIAARSTIGLDAALWAAAIMVVSGTQIIYAQETRPYAMLLMLGMIAVLLVLRIERHGPSILNACGLTLCILAMLLTHYFALGAVLAVFAYSVCFLKGRPRKTLIGCVIAVGLLFAVIWGPLMWRQIPRFSTDDRAAQFLHEAAVGHLPRTCWRLATMPMSMLADLRPIPMVYALGICVFALILCHLIRPRRAAFWSMWYCCILTVPLLLDLSRSTAHLNYVRYTLLAAPAVYAIIGSTSIPTCPRLFHRIVPVAAIAFCLLMLPRAYNTDKPDFRAMGYALRSVAKPEEPIVFAGPAQTYAPQTLYLAASHYAGPLQGPVMLIETPATSAIMHQLQIYPRVWMVCDPQVQSASVWLPGYRITAGNSWPVVGSLVEMVRE